MAWSWGRQAVWLLDHRERPKGLRTGRAKALRKYWMLTNTRSPPRRDTVTDEGTTGQKGTDCSVQYVKSNWTSQDCTAERKKMRQARAYIGEFWRETNNLRARSWLVDWEVVNLKSLARDWRISIPSGFRILGKALSPHKCNKIHENTEVHTLLNSNF